MVQKSRYSNTVLEVCSKNLILVYFKHLAKYWQREAGGKAWLGLAELGWDETSLFSLSSLSSLL